MTCCTPQDQPVNAKDALATSVDGDTEMRDMAAFAQKCQGTFSQEMSDCCAQMRVQTHSGPAQG